MLKNTIGKFSYILANIYWVCISFICYQTVLFLPMDGYTANMSKLILWIIVITNVLLGIIFNLRNNRNYLSIIINILLPFEIYAILSYFVYFKKWTVITIVITAILSFGFALIIFFNNIPKGKFFSKPLFRLLKHIFLKTRVIVAICLCVFIIPLSMNSFLGRDLYEPKSSINVSTENISEWTIANNMESILLIKPGSWDTLSIEQRLDVLVVLVNIERNYLGITSEIHLSADNLDENTLGCYISNDNKIKLNIVHLKNSPVAKVVHTLLHECYHSYTEQQIEVYNLIPEEYKNMLLFRNAQIYQEEYSNYIDGDDSYYEYASQYCEKHANAYADNAVESYYKAIFEYENKRE